MDKPGLAELARAALRNTVFKSSETALTALRGNALALKMLIQDGARNLGKRGMVLLRMLANVTADHLLELLEVDSGVRSGVSTAMPEVMQPLDITYCVDAALGLLWEVGPDFWNLSMEEKKRAVLYVSPEMMVYASDVAKEVGLDVIY